MRTDLEISIKKGLDYPEPLLNDDDVKDLYPLLGEYYPEIAKIYYEQGMNIFGPFIGDHDIYKREIWTVNLKTAGSDAVPPGLWPTLPALDLKGLPEQGPEESGGGTADENTENTGSAIGALGLPPLDLPDPDKTPRPRPSIQLPVSYGDSPPPFGLAPSDGEHNSVSTPPRKTIALPEVDDDTADFQPEPAAGGQAANHIIGLAFALPSTIRLGEVDVPQSDNSCGPSTSLRLSAQSKGKQPEKDTQSYDIGVLLNVDLARKEPLFRSLFEDGETIGSMKTTWVMEAIYRILFDLEGMVKFDDDLQIRVVIQRSADAIERETCDSIVSAFILAGFESPAESIEYELFDQTILSMRASAWKDHKDILWACIEGSRSAHQAKFNKEEGNVVENANGEATGKGKNAVDDGNEKIDKGKGKAVDKGYYEEATPESLGLLGLDTGRELFE